MTVYDLAAIIEAEQAKAAPIEVKAGDRTFSIPNPVLWPDAVFEASDVEGARILLGDDYDAWCEAGGTARIMFRIVQQAQGASVPE